LHLNLKRKQNLNNFRQNSKGIFFEPIIQSFFLVQGGKADLGTAIAPAFCLGMYSLCGCSLLKFENEIETRNIPIVLKTSKILKLKTDDSFCDSQSV
jgi:hypothetical protein